MNSLFNNDPFATYSMRQWGNSEYRRPINHMELLITEYIYVQP